MAWVLVYENGTDKSDFMTYYFHHKENAMNFAEMHFNDNKIHLSEFNREPIEFFIGKKLKWNSDDNEVFVAEIAFQDEDPQYDPIVYCRYSLAEFTFSDRK